MRGGHGVVCPSKDIPVSRAVADGCTVSYACVHSAESTFGHRL